MAASDFVVKYGCKWGAYEPEIMIEMSMIRKGGQIRKQGGEVVGNGLFWHFRRFQELLWPEKAWHRWNILQTECFLKYRIIGEMGPASSGKTHSAATNVLADYYVWADCTTVLVSSTEREMLELRVWGEIKKLHRMAKGRYEFLPGNLIESRQRIVTDNAFESAEGRDFRNGICGVPLKKGGAYQGLGCFAAGTLIDTPTGLKTIESLKPGDLVLNATGASRVRHTMVREALQLVRVHHAGGCFDCTPEHPVLTNMGWVNAIDITTQHMLVSTNEAMQILRQTPDWRATEQGVLLKEMQMEGAVQTAILPHLFKGVSEAYTWKKEVLLKGMPTQCVGQELQGMRETVQAIRTKGGFLHEVLCSELESETARHNGQDGGWPRLGKGREEGKPYNHAQQSGKGTSQCSHESQEPNGQKAEYENCAGRNNPPDVSRGQLQHNDCTCSAGFDLARNQTGSRDRRFPSSVRTASRMGQAEGANTGFLRVDRIEVLQRASTEQSTFGQTRHQVYNLEVEGHPSYSVTGVLVHNSWAGIKNKRMRMVADELHLCPRIFIDAIANLGKNKEFKCIGLGNPKETTDALGIICEPSAELGGWDGGVDQSPGTKTWPTRFENGICIQLPGSDSPNLDGALGIPLITQEQIDADIKFFGRDSLNFTMMDEGRMPRGQGLRRVITRQQCLKFGAMEAPIWKDSQRIKVAGLDASYGAVGEGDRTIFAELQFGLDVNGIMLLAMVETLLVPINGSSAEIPEDQIALFVKTQCEARGIAPQNMFFDSTGKGTLMGAFARLWSPNVVPIEFGGKPTERFVDADVRLSDKTRVMAREYFGKRVTELWFDVAHVIRASQFRGMTEEVMMEGCMREWGFTGANKIDVEKKELTKVKNGRSPDLFDALAVAVEGAIQRGFVIKTKLAAARPQDEKWKDDLKERARKVRRAHSLNYAA